MTDNRIHLQASARNLDPIMGELKSLGPLKGRALELASGTGQHAAAITAAFPDLIWQPTDIDPDRLASITSWREITCRANFRAPIPLDATKPGWAQTHGPIDLIYLVNLLHLISTPAATALLSEVPLALATGGIAVLYGPFLRDGRATSPGDARFDATLREQGQGAGYKDIAWVIAALAPLTVEIRQMPANNLLLIAS